MAEKIVPVEATGRRKTASAHVKLVPGSGAMIVNRREFADYFPAEAIRNYILQPMKLVEAAEKFDVTSTVSGGGISGQAGALRHALSRALVRGDASLRTLVKSKGCLTRDPREKERKKSGQPGARKRFQFSKR